MPEKYALEFLNAALPFYAHLGNDEKDLVSASLILKSFKEGELISRGSGECSGLAVIREGQIRVYTVSPEGKEITLYRLLEGDVCILSAGCMLKDINFTVSLAAEVQSEIIFIPTNIYDQLNERIREVKDFTLELIAGRLSDVMWTLQQFVFTGMAKRLAGALIEHSVLMDSQELTLTHEDLARDLGSAREVVTRLLKQFSDEGLIEVKRGRIIILDRDSLMNI